MLSDIPPPLESRACEWETEVLGSHRVLIRYVCSCLTVEGDLQANASVMHSKRRASQEGSSSLLKCLVPCRFPFCGHSATKMSSTGITAGAETSPALADAVQP